jgi:hypothetical protein
MPASGISLLSPNPLFGSNHKISTVHPRRWLASILRTVACLLVAAALAPCVCRAQSAELPFQVSNPKHKKWPADEAAKIYTSACEMAARAIRPEKPPQLHPKFVLVLGASGDEAVRYGETSELRLKNWDPARFAQAVLVFAVRDVLSSQQMTGIVRNIVLSSQASISVDQLKQDH